MCPGWNQCNGKGHVSILEKTNNAITAVLPKEIRMAKSGANRYRDYEQPSLYIGRTRIAVLLV